MRSITFLLLSACSDYDLVALQLEDPADIPSAETVIEDNETCQHDRSAYIEAEVVSLGQDTWTPGWNTVAEFTLTTDKDTCFDQTFAIEFATTDNANTNWNDCEEYVGQDRLHILRVNDADSNGDVLEELNTSWTFQGATGDWGAYVHYCEPGRFIVDARPLFVHEDTALLADDPLTFVVIMEARGSVEDMMRVDLLWDDSSRLGTNSGNLHQREGEPLLFQNE